jgi:hypothetical protein
MSIDNNTDASTHPVPAPQILSVFTGIWKLQIQETQYHVF